MIIRAEDGRLVCIRQVDHAHLSGALAAAWGGGDWAAPEPRDGVLAGAARHDDAWEEWDVSPEVRDGRPLGFHEVDRVTTSALYAAGAERVSAADAYAGLLTSLHFSGFFHSHWGWQPFSTPERFPEPQASALRGFVAGELTRQQQLRALLGLTAADERRLEVNYKSLQLWDRISLDICRRSRVEPWVIDYPAIPTGTQGGHDVALKFAMPAPGRYTLNPWPLSVTPFIAAVPASAVADDLYSSREAFATALAAADRVELALRVEPV